MNNSPEHLKGLWRKTGWLILGVLLLGIGLNILVNHIPKTYYKQYANPLNALIILLIGGAISYLLERYLFRLATVKLGARRIASLRFLIRLVLYVSIALAVMAAFGVGISSVVFGGAFFTVIVGLAGQSLFGNLIAGLGLIIFHPFEIGDHITFVTWQYPILMPSYPHEAMKPGYSGTVNDINLMYTTLITNSGLPMTIPNGIIIQAAIENNERSGVRRSRLRFDVDMAINSEQLMELAEKALTGIGYRVKLNIIDLAPTTYTLAIDVESRRKDDESVKSDVLRTLIPILDELRTPLDSVRRSKETS